MKEVDHSGPVRFGIVSVLLFAALLCFGDKPELAFVALLTIVLADTLFQKLWKQRQNSPCARMDACESGTQTKLPGRRVLIMCRQPTRIPSRKAFMVNSMKRTFAVNRKL